MAHSTNVGPVTTLFKPPSSCLDTYTLGVDKSVFETSFSLFVGNFNGNYSGNNYLTAATSCYPSPTTSLDFWANYYYSPAYCPSGYEPACTYTAGIPLPIVTASLCCPTGFNCVDQWAHGCQRLTSGTVSNVFIASARTATVKNEKDLTSLKIDGSQYIWHDGIPVAWEPTDSAILDLIAQQTPSKHAKTTDSASISPTSPSVTAVPSRPTSSISPSTSSPTTAASSKSLSTGARIGIAVTASSTGILLVILGAIFLRRMLKKRRQVAVEGQHQHAYPVEKYAMWNELEAPPSELQGDTMRVQELPEQNGRQELGTVEWKKCESKSISVDECQ